jgi:hypothetical protein
VKIFSSSKLTKIQLQSLICVTAKKFGVKKVCFNSKGKYVRGTYNAFNHVLYLDTKQTKKEMLNTFFHELGHHFAVKHNRWKTYHFNLVPSINFDRMFLIENRIDRSAKKLWNKYVDTKIWGRYKYVYLKTNKNYIMNILLQRKYL